MSKLKVKLSVAWEDGRGNIYAYCYWSSVECSSGGWVKIGVIH